MSIDCADYHARVPQCQQTDFDSFVAGGESRNADRDQAERGRPARVQARSEAQGARNGTVQPCGFATAFLISENR
jgi:hypothetical protein